MNRETFLHFLKQTLPEVNWESPDPLMESGELTSLDVMVLSAALYQREKVQIPPFELKAENFACVDTIYRLYRKGEIRS